MFAIMNSKTHIGSHRSRFVPRFCWIVRICVCRSLELSGGEIRVGAGNGLLDFVDADVVGGELVGDPPARAPRISVRRTPARAKRRSPWRCAATSEYRRTRKSCRAAGCWNPEPRRAPAVRRDSLSGTTEAAAYWPATARPPPKSALEYPAPRRRYCGRARTAR